MRCLAHAIGQSLEQAYAHHIQRLMVIGNFALLAGLDPASVHRWYLGVYVDAFELYWDFFARNAGRLSTDPRLGLVYRQLTKLDEATLRSLQEQADELRNSLDRL